MLEAVQFADGFAFRGARAGRFLCVRSVGGELFIGDWHCEISSAKVWHADLPFFQEIAVRG
jgi:hypothetical protein